MDTRGFLEKVVAWDCLGSIAICWQQPGGSWRTIWCSTIDSVLTAVDNLKSGKCNIYFSLAKFDIENDNKRTAENAVALRSIFFDMDVEAGNPKKYDTIRQAVDAVFCFCQAVGIPFPSFVVVSGSGIHVYWCSYITLSKDEWFVYATALKRAAFNYGLKFDAGVTTDAARV